MPMETKISLNNLRFYAYHGVMAQERRVGNHYEVSLEVKYPFEQALKSDNLEDTLDYSRLYAIVEREMSEPSQLLEHVAGRIYEAISEEFPQIMGGSLSITKLHPPFKCDAPHGAVSVYIAW